MQILVIFVLKLFLQLDLSKGGTYCPAGWFWCDSHCLTANLLCDGKEDCSNGFDEKNCSLPCSINDFQCMESKNCVSREKVCDDVADCSDGSDEFNCSVTCLTNELTCTTILNIKECLTPDLICDGVKICLDNSDEINCKSHACAQGHIKCGDDNDFVCISPEQVCDGIEDCQSGEDEDNCDASRTALVCTANERACTKDHRNVCLSEDRVCDGVVDCDGGVDEKGCGGCVRQQQDCGTDEFWCGVVCECMPLWWMCDGEVDCEHDEDTCTHIAPACNQIKEYKCDGVAQCVDGSDEVMCEEGWEKGRDFMRDKETDQPCHGSFQCYNDLSDSCVSYHKICDGVKDCPYGEDENKCSYGDNPCKNNNGGCSHTCTHLPTDAWRRSKKVQKGGFFNRLNIGKTPPPPTHKCLCPEGFELDCDNRTCVDIDECLHSHTCSHTCVNKHGFYVCLCHEGYVLGKDLKSCVVKGDRPRLLFSRDNTIIRSYLRNELAGTNKNNNNNSNNKNNIKNEANPKKHDTNNSNHINQSYSTIKNISDWLSFRHKLTSFDLDLHSKKIIFTDGFDLFIHRIDIGSTLKVPSKDCVDRPNFQQQQSETTTSQSPPLQHPHHTSPPPSPPIINSLVHDWLHGNTYLSNIGSHTIQLVTHALVCVRVLYVRQPNLLAIDPRKRFLFWTSSSEETSLFRSHLDGSGVTAVLSRDQAPRVTAVAIDPTNGQVYITEAVTHTLSTMHEDGGARRVLLSSTTILKMPGSVMVFEDTVYWTDIKRKKIYYTNKYPSKQRRLVNEIETSATRLLVSHPVLFDEEQDIHECTHGYLPVNATSHICIYPQEVQQAKSWWLFVFVFLPLILFLVFVFLFVYSYLRKKKRGRVGVQLPHPSIEPLFATSQSKHI